MPLLYVTLIDNGVRTQLRRLFLQLEIHIFDCRRFREHRSLRNLRRYFPARFVRLRGAIGVNCNFGNPHVAHSPKVEFNGNRRQATLKSGI